MKKSFIILLCFFLLQMGRDTFAQSISGTIYGRVSDDKNMPLAFATVRALKDGILKGGAKTDSNGDYRIMPLEPGNYTVKVEFLSKNPEEMIDVPVSNDSKRKVDFRMTNKVDYHPHRLNIRRTVTVPLIDPSDPCTKVLWRSDMKRLPIQ
ncbi:MAG: carboxypeptidase regulatory-like domain-containing protein [Chitinophagaceae bacterium]|nr:carboxypeptidase regulatory-like domain-containing protein [Chitinophagaceae bacterium]